VKVKRAFRKGIVVARANPVTATVASDVSGAIYTLRTLALTGNVTWAKVSGDDNLTVSSGAIVAANGLEIGDTQSLIVRGVSGNQAVEFEITLQTRADAPVLTSATVTDITETTATIGATTDKTVGTLYYIITTGGEPSAAQIRNGLNAGGIAAVASGSQAVTLSGAKTFSVTGLLPGTTYTAYFVHEDGLGQPSNVLGSASFATDEAADVTAPVLSAASDAANGATGASLNVTTDEGNGTLYWFVSTSASAPTAADLKAGTGAAQAGSVAVSAATAFPISVTGLAAATAYYSYFLHRDLAGNDSDIAEGGGFTTDAAGSAPVNTVAPAIAGTAEIGAALSVTSNGTWGNAPSSYSYQWQRETGIGAGTFANVLGSTGSTYVLGAADEDLLVRVRVTATNATGSTTASSNEIGPIVTGAGEALIATDYFVRTTGASTYPPQVYFNRPMEWQDGDIAVMQRSQDATFGTGVSEATQTLYSATLTYDFGLSNITSGSWFMRLAAYRGDRPASLNWSTVVNVGAVIPPLLSATGPTTFAELEPLADVITASEPVFFAIGGTDAALLELSTQAAATSVTVRLLGDAHLNFDTKASYSYSVTGTGYGGLTSSPLVRSITVTDADNSPDAFSFTDVTGATTSTVYESNTITVAGLGVSVSADVTITGGEYSKNGGAYTSDPGTAENGDEFVVRVLSSANAAAGVSATLTIGGVSDTYAVTTSGFSPGDLWLASEAGDWWDINDLGSMYQDTAGTTPAAVGQPVNRMVGKVNGTVLTPTTSDFIDAPTLRHNGTNYYLEFVNASGLSDDLQIASLQGCDPTTGHLSMWCAPSVPSAAATVGIISHDNGSSSRIGFLQIHLSDARIARFSSGSLGSDYSGGTVANNTAYTHIGVAGAAIEAFLNNTSNGSSAVGVGTPNKTAAPFKVCQLITANLYGSFGIIGRAIDSTERGDLHTWLDNRI
jgi:hypothetical protein